MSGLNNPPYDLTLNSLRIDNASPVLQMNESDQASSSRLWRFVVNGLNWVLQARNDADSSGSNAIAVLRSGTSIAQIDLAATAVNINGRDAELFLPKAGGTVSAAGTLTNGVNITAVTKTANGKYTIDMAGGLFSGTDYRVDLEMDYNAGGYASFPGVEYVSATQFKFHNMHYSVSGFSDGAFKFAVSKR